MAIAFDASSVVENATNNNSINLSQTCTGSQLILIVSTYEIGGDTITGVTYNSVAMTELGTVLTIAANKMRTWSLIAPATGAHNITVSRPGASAVSIGGSSYTGVAQSGFPDATTTASGTSTSAASSLSSVADNCWHIMAAGGDGSGGLNSDGGNWTIRGNAFTKGTIGDSNSAKHPAGSVTQTCTLSASQAWKVRQFTIAPFVAVGPTNVKTWDGITQSTGVKTYNGVALASVKTWNGIT